MHGSNLIIPILIATVGPLTWTAAAVGPDRPDAFAQAARNVREIIAHRGSMIDRPENTLASYRRAIEVGATVTECDARTP
jgi:glycerophosphoryl diester phosphodiesterase